MSVENLTPTQMKGLNKLGDVLLSGSNLMPDFSKTGCSGEIDRILNYMPEKDRSDLKMLLGIFGVLPRFFCAFFIFVLEFGSKHFPEFIAAELKFIRIGLRGLAFTLYYSHPIVHEKLGYQVDVYTADLETI